MPLRPFDVYWAVDQSQMSRINTAPVEVETHQPSGGPRPAGEVAEEAVRNLLAKQSVQSGRYLVLQRGQGTFVRVDQAESFTIKAE